MLEQADCCTNSNKDNEELTTPKCALRWPEAWKRGERGWRRGVSQVPVFVVAG